MHSWFISLKSLVYIFSCNVDFEKYCCQMSSVLYIRVYHRYYKNHIYSIHTPYSDVRLIFSREFIPANKTRTTRNRFRFRFREIGINGTGKGNELFLFPAFPEKHKNTINSFFLKSVIYLFIIDFYSYCRVKSSTNCIYINLKFE